MKRIRLTQSKSAIVDDDIFEILNQVNWYAKKNWQFYAQRNLLIGKYKRRSEFMHWYVIGYPLHGLCVDHINGNGLDNRRSNLRIVTNSENQGNRKHHRRMGRLAGTSYSAKRDNFISQFRLNKKRHYFGAFKTEAEAHTAYKNGVARLLRAGP